MWYGSQVIVSIAVLERAVFFISNKYLLFYSLLSKRFSV